MVAVLEAPLEVLFPTTAEVEAAQRDVVQMEV
jgi:hypothetical protein